jgi:purine-binding chemotaxis protein CheW
MSAIENIEAAARAGGVPLGSSDAAAGKEFLTFRLGSEEYAIDILKVQEIRGYEIATKFATAPAFIKGVVNLRGVIVPIVDLRMKFNLPTADYDESTVTIILNVMGRVVGAVVDSVSDVLELRGEQIKPAPEFSGSLDASFITGMGTVKQGEEERMLILIDIEQLMATADMGLVRAPVPSSTQPEAMAVSN